jgi:hypothetical protein
MTFVIIESQYLLSVKPYRGLKPLLVVCRDLNDQKSLNRLHRIHIGNRQIQVFFP